MGEVVDSTAFRLAFGAALPMVCFWVLGALPLLVFAAVVCAGLAWWVVSEPPRGSVRRPLQAGVLMAGMFACSLGVILPGMLLPIAVLASFSDPGMWWTVPMGLGPWLAFVVYWRLLPRGLMEATAWRPVGLIIAGVLLPFALGMGVDRVASNGIGRSLTRIEDPGVPLREAVDSARWWSWATDWEGLVRVYARVSVYEDQSAARRVGRAYHALDGEHPQRALARMGARD